MELVSDAAGQPAPRLNDIELSEEQALEFHGFLLNQVVRMLCAGLIHGDLSEYNILVGELGPVIIDLPQAVDAAGNNSAEQMLERDVANLTNYFGHFARVSLAARLARKYGRSTREACYTRYAVNRTHRSGRTQRRRRRSSE